MFEYLRKLKKGTLVWQYNQQMYTTNVEERLNSDRLKERGNTREEAPWNTEKCKILI